MNGVVIDWPARAALPALIGLLLILGACIQVETDDAVVLEDTTAAQDTLVAVDPIARGEASYMTYCASCHGRGGEGDGPVAEVLTVSPADLTQLRVENVGAYPVDSIYAYIDGRADIEAHGTREMPVWGNMWGEVGGETVPRQEVDQRSRELVEYIRTLQDDPDTPQEPDTVTEPDTITEPDTAQESA